MTVAELKLLLPDTDDGLPAAARAKVVAFGPAVHTPLVEFLAEEARAIRAGQGTTPRYRAGYAGELVSDLHLEAAIPSLIEIITFGERVPWAVLGAATGLAAFGPRMVEPVLAIWHRVRDRHGVGMVLSNVGKGDPRVFPLLEQWFEDDPAAAWMCLAEFGDARALPLLRERLAGLEVGPFEGFFDYELVRDLAEGIEKLGCPLTPEEARKVDAVMAGGQAFMRCHFTARSVTPPAHSHANECQATQRALATLAAGLFACGRPSFPPDRT